MYDNNSGKFYIQDQGKTKSYNSLSISIDYLPNVFKATAGKSTVFVFSVTNVLGNDQLFGYNYSYNGLHKITNNSTCKNICVYRSLFQFWRGSFSRCN